MAGSDELKEASKKLADAIENLRMRPVLFSETNGIWGPTAYMANLMVEKDNPNIVFTGPQKNINKKQISDYQKFYPKYIEAKNEFDKLNRHEMLKNLRFEKIPQALEFQNTATDMEEAKKNSLNGKKVAQKR